MLSSRSRFKCLAGFFLSHIRQSLFVVFYPEGCKVNYQLNSLPYLSSLHLHSENKQAIFIYHFILTAQSLCH